MKLMIFNGSPRGSKSNSSRMIPWITDRPVEEICYLNKTSLHRSFIERSQSADALLFVFPLYVDSMPGITKAFFEHMETDKEAFSSKPVYFVIHSGFPEMIQSKSLCRYIEYFAITIMNMDYRGTVIIAGSEAMQMAPDGAFRKLQSNLKVIGNAIENNKVIPENINILINKREKLTAFQLFVFRVNPLKNFYWNYRAQKHGGKINLTDMPYA